MRVTSERSSLGDWTFLIGPDCRNVMPAGIHPACLRKPHRLPLRGSDEKKCGSDEKSQASHERQESSEVSANLGGQSSRFDFRGFPKPRKSVLSPLSPARPPRFRKTSEVEGYARRRRATTVTAAMASAAAAGNAAIGAAAAGDGAWPAFSSLSSTAVGVWQLWTITSSTSQPESLTELSEPRRMRNCTVWPA